MSINGFYSSWLIDGGLRRYHVNQWFLFFLANRWGLEAIPYQSMVFIFLG